MSLFQRPIGKAADGTVLRSKYWTYKFDFQGKQIPRTTLFTNKADAKRAMEIHRQALERGRYDIADQLRRRSAASPTTIGEILEAFVDPKAPLESKLKTRIACANGLRNALRRVHGDATDVEKLSVSAVSSTFVERYFADATVRANATPNQAKAASTKRTAASSLRHALSVFSYPAQRYYRTLKLQLPDMLAVRQSVKECRFTRIPKHEYVAAPESVIAATLAAWEVLEDRDIFLCVGHALAFGLRKSDIGQARWTWHVQQSGQPFLHTTAYSSKDQSGRLTIRALDPFYSTMMKRIAEKGWRGDDDDYLVPGTDYYRTWSVFNRVNAWLRGLGWETQKAIHALRDYTGSQVALMDDIWTASSWLRHKNVAVTQQSYTSYVSQYSRSNRDQLKVKWA